MRQKILSKIILLTILFAVFFLVYIKFYDREKIFVNNEVPIYQTVCGKYKIGEIKINSKILSVDIADNNCKRNLGLSGKLSLNERGMFFIFEKLGNYGFWMKDMNFPIDILWIDDNFNVVGIEKNIATSTYPQSYGEKYLAQYVLEVSAGYFDRNNVKVGEKIVFNKK